MTRRYRWERTKATVGEFMFVAVFCAAVWVVAVIR